MVRGRQSKQQRHESQRPERKIVISAESVLISTHTLAYAYTHHPGVNATDAIYIPAVGIRCGDLLIAPIPAALWQVEGNELAFVGLFFAYSAADLYYRGCRTRERESFYFFFCSVVESVRFPGSFFFSLLRKYIVVAEGCAPLLLSKTDFTCGIEG